MTKVNIKKKMVGVLEKVGTKQAHNDLNQACACFLYQPKQPRALKRAKK